jgi:hypothetical protein
LKDEAVRQGEVLFFSSSFLDARRF